MNICAIGAHLCKAIIDKHIVCQEKIRWLKDPFSLHAANEMIEAKECPEDPGEI